MSSFGALFTFPGLRVELNLDMLRHDDYNNLPGLQFLFFNRLSTVRQ